jgi:hypothetical protein
MNVCITFQLYLVEYPLDRTLGGPENCFGTRIEENMSMSMVGKELLPDSFSYSSLSIFCNRNYKIVRQELWDKLE